MDFSLFHLVNYILLFVLAVLFIRYIYIMYADRRIRPPEWQQALKEGRISRRLKELERRYPEKVRFHTWWLQFERLKRENVAGMMAELGVYQGESAEVLHQMAPDRDFHLFDTFTGFTSTDLQTETGEAATYTTANFSDTSIKIVLEKIDGNDHIRVHQGYFPGSAPEFRQPFAFVNIDVDLYNPTKAGLAYFYPRLAPGGVMIIHDYNYKWPGIIRAVDEFVKTIPETPFFVPDKDSSAVIIKNK